VQRLANYATGSRPAANLTTLGATITGGLVHDSTLQRPIFSDGTNWQVIAAKLTATATLDFPSIAANGQQELTITVTGAVTGDAVMLGAPAAIEAGLQWSGWVSAADTVKIRVTNETAGAIDPASATWRATVVK
jgi:hypothetical protein